MFIYYVIQVWGVGAKILDIMPRRKMGYAKTLAVGADRRNDADVQALYVKIFEYYFVNFTMLSATVISYIWGNIIQ